MYSLVGGGSSPPPQALENMYRVEMHVNSPILHSQLKEKKLNR